MNQDLLTLAKYLRDNAEQIKDHFYMVNYCAFSPEAMHIDLNRSESIQYQAESQFKPFDYGTTMCALGWATQIPEFNKRGLRIKFYPDSLGGEVIFQNEAGICAAEHFFDIDYNVVNFLFGPYDNLTLEQVIARIEFVGNGGRCEDYWGA